jgi:hypothetical protein
VIKRLQEGDAAATEAPRRLFHGGRANCDSAALLTDHELPSALNPFDPHPTATSLVRAQRTLNLRAQLNSPIKPGTEPVNLYLQMHHLLD